MDIRKSFKKLKSIAAFTLVELIIVIAIISILAAIVVLTIDPAKLFANARNSQRSQDISTYQAAIGKYIAESPTTSNSRSLADLHGYNNMIVGAAGGSYICPNGSANTSTLSGITSYYSLDNTGPNILDLTVLINNGYLSKVMKDPLTGQDYRACIDTLNNSQLVVYAPSAESTTNIPQSAFNTPSSLTGISSGLVGYWPMDEASGTAVNDNSGAPLNNGTASGTTISLGKYNNARTFNGTSDYVALSSTFGGTKEVTVSAWINTASDTGNIQAIVESSAQTFVHFHLSSSGSISIYTDTGAISLPLVTPTPFNTWRHLVITSKSGSSKLFVNGVQSGSTDTTIYSNILSSSTVSIGRGYVNTRFFSGSLDDVRIYNRALSDNEVSQLYNWGANPVAYYSFDDASGNTVSDSSLNAMNGTWSGSGGHWSSNGKYGYAGTFNGTDDKVSVPYSSLINGPTFTLSAWVKFNVINSADGWIAGNETGAKGFAIFGSGSGATYCAATKFCSFVDNNGAYHYYVGTSTYTTGTWYYETITYDGTSTKLYVNGNLESTNTIGTYNPQVASNIFTMGNWSSGGRNLNGLIDDVKIYTYARTAAQIAADMN